MDHLTLRVAWLFISPLLRIAAWVLLSWVIADYGYRQGNYVTMVFFAAILLTSVIGQALRDTGVDQPL